MAGTGFSIPCPWNVDSRFQSLARFRASYIEQAPAVQKLDNAIHRINLYPVDSAIGFAHTYPLDSEFIRWIELCILWTTGSEFRISNPWTDSGSVYKKKIPGFRNPDYRTPRISITDSILQCGLEIRAGNRTWYLGCLDSFLWKCYPRKRIHCTCHLVTLNIFHWVKNSVVIFAFFL